MLWWKALYLPHLRLFGFALLGRGKHCGVDDRATHCEIAPILEGGIQTGDEFVDRRGLRQTLAEQPYVVASRTMTSRPWPSKRRNDRRPLICNSAVPPDSE